MKYLFVITFIVVYACFGNEIGYTSNSPVWAHITYMFQHTGLIHLLFNSIAFIGMYAALSINIKKWQIITFPIICAFTASFLPLASFDIPTIGASGVVYAMIGMHIAKTLRRAFKNKQYRLYLLCILICLTASLFNPNSNFWLHLYASALGFILQQLKSVFRYKTNYTCVW